MAIGLYRYWPNILLVSLMWDVGQGLKALMWLKAPPTPCHTFPMYPSLDPAHVCTRYRSIENRSLSKFSKTLIRADQSAVFHKVSLTLLSKLPSQAQNIPPSPQPQYHPPSQNISPNHNIIHPWLQLIASWQQQFPLENQHSTLH